MRDEEIGLILWDVWREPTHGLPSAWTKVARRARELLAGEAKPVATREAIKNWVANYLRTTPNTNTYEDMVSGALAHFAPPAPEQPPIAALSWDAIASEMNFDKGILAAADANDIGLVILRCAVVAHRLAQPAPVTAVDPDAEAKRLAWTQHTKLTGPGGSPFQDMNDYFARHNERWKESWRAVAAAKMEGGE